MKAFQVNWYFHFLTTAFMLGEKKTKNINALGLREQKERLLSHFE